MAHNVFAEGQREQSRLIFKRGPVVSAIGSLLFLPFFLRAFYKQRPNGLGLNVVLHCRLDGLNHKILEAQTTKRRICFSLSHEIFGKVAKVDCFRFHDGTNVSYDTDVVYAYFRLSNVFSSGNIQRPKLT